MIQQTLEDIVGQADTILVGGVKRMESQWNADRTEIFTTVTISAAQFLKGRKRDELVVKIPGGEILSEQIGMRVSDSATFHQNEEVLLLLRRGSGEVFDVVFMGQGKFGVLKDRTTGRKKVLDNWGREVSGIKNGKITVSQAPQDKFYLEHLIGYIETRP